MSNQDNINSFLDSMDFDSTPAAGAPSPQSVPFTPAHVQETMLDKFDMVMQNLEVQGEKRMIEALAAKPAIFSYAKVKENIEDRDSTFEDLRQRYEADFPELSDPKTISWTVNYGKQQKA